MRERLRAAAAAILLTAVTGVLVARGDAFDTHTVGASLGGEHFNLELAITPDERRIGLMARSHLPADRGMLFVYEVSQPVRFWNKNVPIPLDILYFDDARRLIRFDQHVPPCLEGECPYFDCDAPTKYVLELTAGTAKRLGLVPGALLRFD